MRKTLASRAVAGLLLILGSSCSLVYDLSPDQCGSNGDCNKFGQGLECVDGVCICDSTECQGLIMTGGTSNGGSGGKGGAGGAGGTAGTALGGDAGEVATGGTSVTAGRGGSSAQGGSTTGGKGGKGGTGSGATAGTTATAGMGGEPFVPECDTHVDCYNADKGDFAINPKACVNQQCIPLKTDECPLVLPLSEEGTWNMLRSSDAIILGGFAQVLTGGVASNYIRNYDLALSELEDQTGGVYAGSSTRHKVMMVVCHPYYEVQSDLLVPAKHLIEDLQVKGIVAQMLTEDQEYVFDALGTKDKNNVFFMMTRYSDEQLNSLDDDGLVWHMLSGAPALSTAIQPMLDSIQTHLRNLGTVGTSEDLRVTLIKAPDERFLNDMGNYVTQNIVFNGDVGLNQTPDAYQSLTTKTWLDDPNWSQADLVQSVEMFKPHVIISAAMNEMQRNIMPLLESTWDGATSDQDRPFYLLSPFNYADSSLTTLVQNDATDPNGSTMKGKVPLHQRILGFNWSAALDDTLYKGYQLRFQEAYNVPPVPQENYYDGAYYLMYAVAASRLPLSGTRIAESMLRVIDGSTQVPVGPGSAMSSAINGFRDSNYKIELIGAGGPPTWDQFGSRSDPASVFCVDVNGAYLADVQRYNTGTMQLDGSVPTACIDAFPYTP